MQFMCIFSFSKARIKLTVYVITDGMLESRIYGTYTKDKAGKRGPGH